MRGGRSPGELLDHLRVSPEKKDTSRQDPPQQSKSAKRGRPVLFDEVAKAKVLGLITAGISQRMAATFLGIDPSTISKAIKSDPAFAHDLDQAQAASRVHPLLKIVAAADRHWRAAQYLYEKVHPRTDLSDERDAAAARQQDDAFQARVDELMRSAFPRSAPSIGLPVSSEREGDARG